MANWNISFNITLNSNVISVQPGGSAVFRFQVVWSPPSGGDPVAPVHALVGTFSTSPPGSLLTGLPTGVTASITPSRISMDPGGGSAWCSVTYHAASNAPSTNGPAGTNVLLNISGSSQTLSAVVQLTVGPPGVLNQFTTLFSGTLTISHLNPSQAPISLPPPANTSIAQTYEPLAKFN